MTATGTDLYTKLRQALIDGDILDGEILMEGAVAEQYGVSRTPAREALRLLEHDGLIEKRARGFVVRPRSPDEIMQIYEARVILEGAAARSAALNRTTSDLSVIEGVAAEERRIGQSDPDRREALNERFHRAVWNASHNAAFIDLLDRLSLHLIRYSGTTLKHPGRWEQAIAEHDRVVAAIAAGDGDAAEEIVRAHIEAARDIRLSIWRHNPPQR